MYYSKHTLLQCFSAAMDSFHQAWASSWDAAFCRGYEGLTVSLTIYQSKDWRFDCWRDLGGWAGVPLRGIETFMTWTRRVFIACCLVIVFWILLDWAVPRGPGISPGWTTGSIEHSGRLGSEVSTPRLTTIRSDAPPRPWPILICGIMPCCRFATHEDSSILLRSYSNQRQKAPIASFRDSTHEDGATWYMKP